MNAQTTNVLIDAAGATPVMAQYFEARARQPDALVFFRMGDFFELFFEDAQKASAVLGITLTARGQHGGQPIPMAGVPAHAMEAYLAKLIRAGFKVAVCDQLEDAETAKRRGGSKAVVRRDVVRVVTPGTLTEDGLLDARGANRLAAIAVRAGSAAVASVELSTGEVECLSVTVAGLASALAALGPSEILASDRLFADPQAAAALKGAGGFVQPMPGALAEPGASEARLKRLYGVDTLDGFGPLSGAEISALGLIAAHLETTQAGRLPALSTPRRMGEADVMSIDPATRASLEIERSTSGARDGSLLAAIDRTVTAPGARMLAARLARPLLDPAAIDARLDAVGWFVARRPQRQKLRETLRGLPDMARALSRLALGRGGPRDLGALREGLVLAGVVRQLFDGTGEPLGCPPQPNEVADSLQALDLAAQPDLAAFRDLLVQGLGPDLPALAPRSSAFISNSLSRQFEPLSKLRHTFQYLVCIVVTYRLARGPCEFLDFVA